MHNIHIDTRYIYLHHRQCLHCEPEDIYLHLIYTSMPLIYISTPYILSICLLASIYISTPHIHPHHIYVSTPQTVCTSLLACRHICTPHIYPCHLYISTPYICLLTIIYMYTPHTNLHHIYISSPHAVSMSSLACRYISYH